MSSVTNKALKMLLKSNAALVLNITLENLTSVSENPSPPSPRPSTQPSSKSFNITSFLRSLNFQVSYSQPCTPADGNCLFHVLGDQGYFKDHLEARLQIVTNIYDMIEKEMIFWDDSEPLSDWIENMMIPGTHGDSYALQGRKLFSCG